MYHEITDAKRAARRTRLAVIAAIIVALAVACVAIYFAVHENSKTQGALALRNSIINTAKQACSIEGAYPSTLSYLEKNYGLVINHQDYVVTYECFAGNIMPSVVVTPR